MELITTILWGVAGVSVGLFIVNLLVFIGLFSFTIYHVYKLFNE